MDGIGTLLKQGTLNRTGPSPGGRRFHLGRVGAEAGGELMKKCMLIAVVFSLTFVILLSFPVQGETMQEKLKKYQIRKIISIVYNINYIYYSEKSNDVNFFYFQELGKEAGIVGWCAVNKWTGEVWNTWSCHPFTRNSVSTGRRFVDYTKYIKLLSTKIDPVSYQKHKDLKPECMN